MTSTKYNVDANFRDVQIILKERKNELRRHGLEQLLSAVYKRKIVLPIFLEEIGVDKKVVNSLKLRNMDRVVETTIHMIKERLCRAEAGIRRYQIVERYYGLDGNMSARLSAMGAKYGVSRERIRQLKERCLASLRLNESLNSLEDHLRAVSYHSRGVNQQQINDDQTPYQTAKPQFKLSSHRDMTILGDIESYLNEQQRIAFSGMNSSKFVSVSGATGSGKTLLAVLKAYKLSQEGKRVLYTCYNRAFATYLDSILSDLPNVTVASYHALCLRLGTRAGIPIPGGWNNSVWENKFPEVLEKAVEVEPKLKFDSIIVDDAQDLKLKWWQSIEKCLKDPDGGELFQFYDDNQLLASNRQDRPEAKIRYHLSENLRSPGPIVPFMLNTYFSGNKMHSLYRSGEHAEFYLCDTKDDVRLTISHLIEDLTNNCGLIAPDIVVLTHKLVKNSNAYGCSTKRSGRLVARYSQTSNHAMLSRINTFKGLERRAVILVDLDESFAGLDDKEKLRLIYMAASRSSDRLIMIGDQRGWRAINSIARFSKLVGYESNQSKLFGSRK